MRPADQKIYLASKSPRRRELLRQIGVDFILLMLRDQGPRGPDVSEEVIDGEAPEDYVVRVTHEKAAAAWQITPVKSLCLGHCRSPKSCFLRFRRSVTRPVDAFYMGVTSGLYCLGSCWALMAVLVAVGTMNLGWMAALALLILLEKNAPHGERIAVAAAVMLFTLGAVLVAHPATLTTLT